MIYREHIIGTKIRLNEAILRLIRAMASSVAFEIIIMVPFSNPVQRVFCSSSSCQPGPSARIKSPFRKLARIRGQVEGT